MFLCKARLAHETRSAAKFPRSSEVATGGVEEPGGRVDLTESLLRQLQIPAARLLDRGKLANNRATPGRSEEGQLVGGCSLNRFSGICVPLACRPGRRLLDVHDLQSNQGGGGIVPRPYSSNPRFFIYIALSCIMLLCTLG